MRGSSGRRSSVRCSRRNARRMRSSNPSESIDSWVRPRRRSRPSSSSVQHPEFVIDIRGCLRVSLLLLLCCQVPQDTVDRGHLCWHLGTKVSGPLRQIHFFYSKKILTLGTLSLEQMASDKRRSRISHAKIDGHSLLNCAIFPTTSLVATRGLDPPIALGRMDPVS
jgi:hypothetical protein